MKIRKEHRQRVWLIAVLAVVSMIGCGSMSDDGEPPEDAFKVLFVGNSLTYTHDVPEIVASIAEGEGQRPLYHKTMAEPNYAIEDHWTLGGLETHIAEGDWDAVVYQQGPSSLPENQAHLSRWSQVVAEAARQAGTTPAVYMVWPADAHAFTFSAVIESYTNAALASEALLLPAGLAWREAWARDPSLALYGSDGFHQSRLGAYLAALTIYAGLYDDLPERLPLEIRVNGETVRLGGEQGRTLLAAVEAALAASE